jgi:hypothetical protein
MAGGNITGTIPTARLDTGTTANKVVVVGATGLPAVDGSLLTGIVSYTKSASDPTISTNPSGGVGTEWVNHTSGKQFICTDATAGENVWTCSGGGSGHISPFNADFNGERGILAGGSDAQQGNNTINYITIASTGDGTDFGNLTVGRGHDGAGSNGTRGWQAGGMTNHAFAMGVTDTIDYITIGTTGDATDFGNQLRGSGYGGGGSGNDTRGLMHSIGSYSIGTTDMIEYITVASTGDGTDFGNLSRAAGGVGGAANNTRALMIGSCEPASDVIEYVTIMTTGDATDFGDASMSGSHGCGTCDGAKVLSAPNSDCVTGGFQQVEYIADIMTTGNGADFGDFSIGANTSFCGNNTRAVAGPMSRTDNRIEYFTIASLGNATDFGNALANTVGPYAYSGD